MSSNFRWQKPTERRHIFTQKKTNGIIKHYFKIIIFILFFEIILSLILIGQNSVNTFKVHHLFEQQTQINDDE